jgi:two-component system, OmpR family, sensor histidine kinase BaeS
MRLRLVHTLSLLLLSAVLLAVLAMGAVTAWNLKSGFADYLAARDVERLEQFATLVSEAAAQAGGMGALLGERDMRSLLDEFAQRQGLRPARAPAQGPGPPGPGRGGPLPGGGDSFGARVTVVAPDGQLLLARPPRGAMAARASSVVIERPVHVRGEVVALVRMRPTAPAPDGVDARFLRSQYRDIMVVSAGLLVLALIGAVLVARHWVHPLHAVSDAAARIARGEFDIRMSGAEQGQGRSDEIGDLVRSVNHMAEGLQRLEGARRRWLADISHELRTPLAVLRGEIEALVDGVRPLRHEAVLSLRDEVLRMGKLVDDLHLLAMSDLKALPCQFEDNDAATLVDRFVRRFEPRAQAAGLALRLQGDTSGALPVVWDGARIEQLLGNVLENSLRYTDKPGEIVLTLRRSGERVIIDLDDSAPGVPEADLPHLFAPLYSADAARSRQRGGSGLGLAICDAITRSHDGRIEARASRLGGLHVRVDLPATAGTAA